MYRKKYRPTTSLAVNESVEGESIETRIERLMANGDENPEVKELLFTRPQDGVIGGFDIRHDWWDEAIEQTSIMAEKNKELDGARLKKREEMIKKKQEEDKFLRDQAKEQLKNKGQEGGQQGQEGV